MSTLGMSTKRSAVSPLSDNGEDKRQLLDGSYIDSDPDRTILDPEYIGDSVADSPKPAMSSGGTGSVREELRAALSDPDIIVLISTAVAAQVSDRLKKEITGLRNQLLEKDREIMFLRDEVDDLQQYSRRNCLRISPIPETTGESTDAIVKQVAASVGVTLTDEAIDRSHRVGKRASGDQTFDRPILVKLTSYRHKEALMKARRGLNKVDAAKLFPNADWPSLPTPSSAVGKAAPVRKIFVNDDLTRTRAKVAARARQLKREKKIDDTWTRDGIIFLKKGESIYRVVKEREVETFAA